MVAKKAKERKEYLKLYKRKYHSDHAEAINKKRRQNYNPEAARAKYNSFKYKENYDPEKRKAKYEDE